MADFDAKKEKIITNGDVIKAVFPNIKVKYYCNLSGMQTVDVKFADKSFNGHYSVHTFSRDWWGSKYLKFVDVNLMRVLCV